MRRFNCKALWTGSGTLLTDVTVKIDNTGTIIGIEKRSSGDYHCDFAMPSFVDAHAHLTWMVVKQASFDLSAVASSGELLSLVASAAESKHSDIIRGDSFDESVWENSNLPTLQQLDRVSGSVPVFLRRVCGHFALVNSAMLDRIEGSVPGVNRQTGVLKEWPVLNFEKMFPLPDEVVSRSVSSVEETVLSRGVTALRSFESIHTAELLSSSNLGLDVSVATMVEGVKDIPETVSAVREVKLFLDGAFGAGNAALLHPYRDGSEGELHFSDSQLFPVLLKCGAMGLSVAIHAIGGEALQQLDRVSNQVFARLGHGFRITVEHAEDLLSAWPGTWKPENHIFSMQPNFVERWQRKGGMYDIILPLEQSMVLNPFRTVIDSGFTLGFGSDCMPLDPLYGLKGAVNHRSSSQSLAVEEALRAYTLDAALVSGLGHLTAPLGPGRRADMVFLSGNPFNGLDGITVDATVKNGDIVYRFDKSERLSDEFS